MNDPTAVRAAVTSVKRLEPHERGLMLAHLLQLSGKDRRLRFGAAISDAAMRRYVGKIDFRNDAVYAIYTDAELAGLAHVVATADRAELGLSVLERYRGRGLGTALFQRIAVWSRNHGFAVLYTHCLPDNPAMMHMARKAGMRVVIEAGEADAYLELDRAPTLASDFEALFTRAPPADLSVRERVFGSDAPSHPRPTGGTVTPT